MVIDGLIYNVIGVGGRTWGSPIYHDRQILVLTGKTELWTGRNYPGRRGYDPKSCLR
jgi:hypothetical protein